MLKFDWDSAESSGAQEVTWESTSHPRGQSLKPLMCQSAVAQDDRVGGLLPISGKGVTSFATDNSVESQSNFNLQVSLI